MRLITTITLMLTPLLVSCNSDKSATSLKGLLGNLEKKCKDNPTCNADKEQTEIIRYVRKKVLLERDGLSYGHPAESVYWCQGQGMPTAPDYQCRSFSYYADDTDHTLEEGTSAILILPGMKFHFVDEVGKTLVPKKVVVKKDHPAKEEKPLELTPDKEGLFKIPGNFSKTDDYYLLFALDSVEEAGVAKFIWVLRTRGGCESPE